MSVSEGQKLGALTVLTLCLLYYGLSVLLARQPGAGTPSGKAAPPPLPWGRQGPGHVAIELRGGRAEGIYFMPKGTAMDRIAEVAGFDPGQRVLRGLQEEISDGVRLAVSPAGEVTVGEMDAARRLALGLRLDVNRASEGDLSLVPGIGDRMAAQIVRLRLEKGAFHDLSDLMAVPGIKERRLSGLKDYLMVGRAR